MSEDVLKRTRKCPLCGEEIPADIEICPKCGANLELFELEEEFELGEDLTPLESFLDSIGDAEDVDPEKLLEEMKRLVGGSVEEEGGEPEEEVEIPESAPEEAEGEEAGEEEEEIEYVCPVCGGIVGPEDDVCPHCGAVFAEAEEEEEGIDYEKLLEETLDEAKSLIKTLRNKKIDVSDITPFLKNANISRRKGNLEEALKNAEECVKRAKKRL